MELFALDTTKELNDPYFGSNFRFLDIVHVNDTNADMEFLWTSAAPCSKSDPLNKATNSCSSVTWCSNNVQTVLNYTLSLGTLPRPYCMIYRRSTQQLEPTDCSFEALFLCEAPSGAGYKSEMHATFCRRSFNVKQSEAVQIWNTGDLSQAGYGAKVGSPSFIACLERNGSLPYAETKEIFVKLYNYFRSVAPKLTIIWDHGYAVNGTGFMWCRSDVDPLNPSARIPVPVPVAAITNKIPSMLVSLPGKEPNLYAVAVTETLKYDTDVFCRFSPSVKKSCESNVYSTTWNY
ncbi:Hypothetical predicted protein [Cloeon dipterum]|uniref:Uncharacterized protein n=1 Tax=Cloeon dipterum TaxID=197152 RepID=A0A8S1DL35_9INSE|nr:Hypothetical predicted protein [Cloeon dipterum]